MVVLAAVVTVGALVVAFIPSRPSCQDEEMQDAVRRALVDLHPAKIDLEEERRLQTQDGRLIQLACRVDVRSEDGSQRSLLALFEPAPLNRGFSLRLDRDRAGGS